MKCWRLKTVYPTGHVDYDYFNNLLIVLCFADTYRNTMGTKNYLSFRDWS